MGETIIDTALSELNGANEREMVLRAKELINAIAKGQDQIAAIIKEQEVCRAALRELAHAPLDRQTILGG